MQTLKTVWTIEFRLSTKAQNVHLWYVDAKTSVEALWAFRAQYQTAIVDSIYLSPW